MDTCFVIMPIGNQKYGEYSITKEELRSKYDDLIKESLIKAKHDLEIIRADDVSMPGSITNDIFTRIMFSNYVLADITYPNPNVFYELGLRHAITNRTILIREKAIKSDVFDISYLRYIEYENTATGLRELTDNLKKTFSWIDRNPGKPDNNFLELALLTKFEYPRQIDKDRIAMNKSQMITNLFGLFLSKPDLFGKLVDPEISEQEKQKAFISAFQSNPEILKTFLKSMADVIASGGDLDEIFS